MSEKLLAKERGEEAAKLAWEYITSGPGYNPYSPEFPWRTNPTPFSVLVSEILLRRTTASQVRHVYEQLLSRFPNLASLSEADLHELTVILKPLGIVSRAEHLKIITKYLSGVDSHLICEREFLLRIPGVGPYAAGAILSFACEKRAPIVDTGIARFWDRFSGGRIKRRYSPHRDPFAWACSLAYIENFPGNPSLGNYFLLDISRDYCSKKPRCSSCPLLAGCWWDDLSGQTKSFV